MFESIGLNNSTDILRNNLGNLLRKIHAFELFLPSQATEYGKFQKKREFIEDYINKNIKPYLPRIDPKKEPIINHGIFRGIKYESILNLQAGIVQKLMGVYEIEISPFLLDFFKSRYEYVINIGAAEGLFSIVFEKSIPNTPIYSFEQDFYTRMLFRHMCSINQSTNVVVAGSFDLSTVDNIDESKRGFVFSDCEGFESAVFAKERAYKFANCDLVIETHDHFISDITKNLKEALSNTHHLEEVHQIPLSERIKLVKDQQFRQLTVDKQAELLNEDRNPLNHWLIAKSKKHHEAINAT